MMGVSVGKTEHVAGRRVVRRVVVVVSRGAGHRLQRHRVVQLQGLGSRHR